MDKKKRGRFIILILPVMLYGIIAIAFAHALTTVDNINVSDAWYEEGKSLAQSGNYRDAFEVFNKAVELNPRNAKQWARKHVLDSTTIRQGHGELQQSH